MLSRCVAVVDKAFRWFLALLMGLMVLCVTWQIVSRYALGDPSQWTEELARFLLIWIGLLGGSYAYHVKMHLGLDLLAERLQGATRHWHTILIHLLVILFSVTVLIGGGLVIVGLTAELKQYSAALNLPMSFVYSSLPLSGIMLTIYAVLALLESVKALRAEQSGQVSEVRP